MKQNFSKILEEQYTLYVASGANTSISDSELLASRIAVASDNIYINSNSRLNSTGRSCFLNQGIGKGAQFKSSDINCMGAGASHGGYGGVGLALL
jgi:hypothetical protein